LAIWGLAFLATAIISVVYLITDFVFGQPASTILAIVAGLAFAGLWYVLPLIRRRMSPPDA
jgi:hypothetical protein